MSGGRKLVDLCTNSVKSVDDGADLATLVTKATIYTQKFKFSPVLLAYLIRTSDGRKLYILGS